MVAASLQVTSANRLGYAILVAVALHALLLLAISFKLEINRQPQQNIEVTLAIKKQAKAPDKADFIAQANQEAGGQIERKQLPSTQQRSDTIKKVPQQTTATPLPQPTKPVEKPTKTQPVEPEPAHQETVVTEQPAAKTKKVITTKKAVQKAAPVARKREVAQPDTPAPQATSLLARSLQFASLQAQLDKHREQVASKPKIRRLTSAATRQRDDAIYLENWRRKIENIGNLNYPQEARINKLYGSLRLLVAIRADGSVKSIEILESSGHRILDDAAIRIVRLAAPFQPFPVEMRKNTDILEIIRTWKFEKKAYIY